MRSLQFSEFLRILRTIARAIAMMSCLLGTMSLRTPLALASPNPVPHIDSLSPISAPPNGIGFTLTLNGENFVSGAVVSWNGAPLSTTFASATQLTATVTNGLVATSGTGWVTVSNPGGATSNLVFLPIGNSSAHVNFALFPLTAGTNPVGVAQGDFNGDGKLDLVTANYGAGNLSTFLGNGDGTFQVPQTISIGSDTRPVGIVAADFNGDGKLDLAIGYDVQNPSGVSILLGNGDGTFQAIHDFAAGTRTYEMVVGDFNGDGFPDVAVTNDAGGHVQVLLGNGDGTLQAAVPYSVTSSAFYIQEADLNGDGNLDLVVSGEGSGTISVLLGNGDGTFQAEATYTAGTSAQDVAISDFDGDGIPDIVATGTSTMFFLKGVGDGTFLAAQSIPAGFGTFVIASGDFNSDGKLDLAVTKTSGGVGVLVGNGDGTFQSAQSFPGASLTYGIVIGNFNSNGGLAIATTDFTTNKLDVLLQTVSVSPASINFGNQALGAASAAQNFTVTNSTSQLVNFTGITFTGTNVADFGEMDNCGSSLASGASCTVQVTFTPGAAGSRTASLNVADDAPASPQTAAVSGTGTAAPVVSLSATGLAFPNENVGVTSPSQALTITNTGNATLNIASIAVAGTNAADFTSSNNCGTTLAASAMCTITTTFTPAAAGLRSATITLTDDAADSPESISLSGHGLLAATATLSASSLTFSQQLVGSTSSAQAVTLTNTGNAALSITSIAASGANAADFAVTNNCGTSLAASALCSIGATFTPAASGSRSAVITVTDSASGSPQTIALSGTGQDFSLSFASPTATVTAGNAANLQLSITPLAGFSQAITLTCTGAPSLAICTVTPSSVTPTGAAVNVTVTLSTAGQILTMQRYPPPARLTGIAEWQMLLLVALCMFALGSAVRHSHVALAARYVSREWIFGSLLLFAALGVASCTGTVSAPITPKTPAGTYPITITATSGSLTRSTTVNLTVQ